MNYPQFYQAWHATNTTTLNQQQYTDIYTQLKQLQPTSTTYPIPLNAANMEGKTAEKAIAKGILIKIYGEIFPKQKAKTIESISQLKNELQPLRGCLKSFQGINKPLSKPLPDAGRGFETPIPW